MHVCTKVVWGVSMKNKTNNKLISMSLPISLGMLSTFLFQLIDTYFVGKLGALALTALSFSSTLYFLLVGLFIGLAVGVSIMVGKAFGAGEQAYIVRLNLVSILLTLVVSLLISQLLIHFLKPLFSIMGAQQSVLPLIEAYTIPLLRGIPLLALVIVGSGVLRSIAHVRAPEMIMALAGIINLVLDYLLIFGRAGLPQWGIKGAAWATVFSWMFAFIAMGIVMIKVKLFRLFSFKLHSIMALINNLMKLALPTICIQIAGPITLLLVTALLADHSDMAVAAFGVAGRIEILLMIGILAVSSAITPFIAQNKGAKKNSAIEEGIVFGGKASTYLGLIVAGLLFVLAPTIAELFSTDLRVVELTSVYFYIMGLSYVFHGLFLITTSTFNGLELPLRSLKITIVKSFIFTVPFAYMGSIFSVEGIFIGLALANIAGGLYSGRHMQREINKSYSKLSQISIWEDYKQDIKAVFYRNR